MENKDIINPKNKIINSVVNNLTIPKQLDEKEMSAEELKQYKLKNYKEAVENLALMDSDFPFNNSSPDHAAIVLSIMLKYSEHEFRIYDDNLSGDIADLNNDFYVNLENFVASGKTLKIVVDSIKSRENKIFTTLMKLRKQHPTTVFIAIASDSFKNRIRSVYDRPLNFALGDKNSSRIEDVMENITIPHRKAYCCFNNKKYSSKLISAFDSEFKGCLAV